MKTQIENAIRWIDTLPNYKQAPIGKRCRLGDEENGFCCLGAGCKELGIKYRISDVTSEELKLKVGLKDGCGVFYGKKFYNEGSLVEVNDRTNAGFKRIAKLMKTHPEWMFTEEVARGIRKHYELENRR